MMYPETVGFEHPDFTEVDLPAIRSSLALALGQLDTAQRVATASVNPSMSALKGRIGSARNMVNALLNNLQYRY